jgi:hypothetical protein
MTTKSAVYWSGEVARCDVCLQPHGKRFIDGRTTSGSWALMDPRCHEAYGVGLGVGRGQAYEKQTDGRYLKIEG